jgi:ADP-ribose pyrophosphatase
MELKRITREVRYRGRIIDLIVDQVQYPTGATSVREIAHHPGGSAVVPLFDDGRVMLIRQLRYPFGRHLYEIPAGKISEGEHPVDAAAREFEEETGWRAGSLQLLTSVYTSPGFCDEIIHIYLGEQLAETDDGPRREEGEFTMTVSFFPLSAALAMVQNGEIHDAKTIIGLLLAAQHPSFKGVQDVIR